MTSGKTIGIGASIRILNGCEVKFNRILTASFPKNFLPAAESLEYLRAFCLRDGIDAINRNFIVSGAFSIYPRKLIVEVGGFQTTPGEDVEIVVRLHRVMAEKNIDYQIQYFPDPVAYTVAPDNLKDLGKQRSNWHLALLETIWIHKRMCFNPRYKIFGLFSFPFWLFGETLEPLVELTGIIYVIITFFLGILNVDFLILFVAISLGYTFLYTIFALVVEEFTFRQFPTLRSLGMLLVANLCENIGYRQLTLFWRIRSYFLFFKKWGLVRKNLKLINELIQKAKQKNLKKSI